MLEGGMVAVDRLLSVEELAETCGVPIRTVYAWRQGGLGPRGVRVGRFVRYRAADVERWLEEQADPQPNGAALGGAHPRVGRRATG